MQVKDRYVYNQIRFYKIYNFRIPSLGTLLVYKLADFGLELVRITYYLSYIRDDGNITYLYVNLKIVFRFVQHKLDSLTQTPREGRGVKERFELWNLE